MNSKNTYKEFDAATVALEGSNLIEASAGTGKTYSIAILVLRLVLEQQLSVKEVLMVTFTKAAVAELEERIRLFIRSAYKVSTGKTIKDDNIISLVQKAIAASDEKQVEQRLKEAVLFLDETSVLTIHSFCQQTLNEFAFETDQLFGAEMLEDPQQLVEDEVQRFWRKYVTTLKVELLQQIWSKDLMENIVKASIEHLSGKKYLSYDDAKDYSITEAEQDEWVKELTAVTQKKEAAATAVLEYIITHAARLKALSESNGYAKKSLLLLIDTPAVFLSEMLKKRTSAYIPKLYQDILDLADQAEMAEEAHKAISNAIHIRLQCFAISKVAAGVQEFKQRNNLLGYDDMISNLHKALVERDNPALMAAMQNKYRAVFVDEFQDTDRQQFEIFDKAYGTGTILFYIGDPKQSIYAWRKADIFTYFKARDGVSNLYSMNRNYRSSAPLISAMNNFFLPTPDFDTFYFKGEEDVIEYQEVESPAQNTKGLFYKNNVADAPISIYKLPNTEQLVEAVGAQVALLLQPGSYRIEDEPIRPSDIGILVRSRRQGMDVKAALARLGIPAVTIDDAKVLQTEEATYLLYLMEAMTDPDRSSINRALLSSFTGLTVAEILILDDEVTLGLFSNYKNRWTQDGIYTALMDFVADFDVRNILLQSENGERIMTNLFQLIELVHQAQSRKNLSMAELISWLKRGIDGMATDGDEYMLRVESDEEAVKIVTIHKSKGLEYKIVLAPFLDFAESRNIELVSYRDPETGDYVAAEKSKLTEDQEKWYKQQAEQENRRLLYVAITRAVYKCYIFRNSYYYVSTLLEFLKAITPDDVLIKAETEIPEAKGYRYRENIPAPARITQDTVHFSLKEQYWRKMSYTMLAAKHEILPRERALPQENEYDTFIFNTLRRGAKTGNLLHFIFEKVDFTDDTRWGKWLEEAVRRFAPGQQELYLPMLRQLLEHVLNAVIHIEGETFSLSSVSLRRRITEFEFDFPVAAFETAQLNSLSDTVAIVAVKLNNGELEGIMNGKMDLFFEHNGKYYILDWKSNYLGFSMPDYSPEALAAALNENNYHLQYLLYTVAAKKYLETRLPAFDYETQFGGVIYLFVRGVRKEGDTGIFVTKPTYERILALEAILAG